MDRLVVSPGAGMMWGRSESLEVQEEWTGSARHLEVSCGQTDVHCLLPQELCSWHKSLNLFKP